jgi:putative PIN family toxin of toxin-antitoxin system
LLVDAFLDGHFEMLISPKLIAELTDVLGREKFAAHAADGRALAFIAVPLDRAEMVKDAAPASLKTADADDDYLIAVAQAHKADAVVSGDGHLLDVTSSDLPVLTRHAKWPTVSDSHRQADRGQLSSGIRDVRQEVAEHKLVAGPTTGDWPYGHRKCNLVQV